MSVRGTGGIENCKTIVSDKLIIPNFVIATFSIV